MTPSFSYSLRVNLSRLPSFCFLFAYNLFCGLESRGSVEEFLEHYSNAESFYYLARERNNPLKDIKLTLSEIDKAKKVMEAIPLESISDEYRTKLDALEKQVLVQQSEAQRILGNRYHGGALFLGIEGVFEPWEEPMRASVRNALEDLIERAEFNKSTEFGLPFDNLLHLVVFHGDGGSAEAAEYAYTHLSQERRYYLLGKHEYSHLVKDSGVLKISGLGASAGQISNLCSDFKVPGIGFLEIKCDEVTSRIYKTELEFVYWDNAQKAFTRKHYSNGFAEVPANFAKIAYFLLGVPLLAAFVYRPRKKGRGRIRRAPWYLGLLAAALAFALSFGISKLLGFAKFDLSQPWWNPTGFFYLAVIPMVTVLLPQPLVVFGLWKLPNIGSIINRRDTLALCILGSFTGGILQITVYTVLCSVNPAETLAWALGVVLFAGILSWYSAKFLEEYLGRNSKDMAAYSLVSLLGLCVLAGLFYATNWKVLLIVAPVIGVLVFSLSKQRRGAVATTEDQQEDADSLLGLAGLQEYLHNPDATLPNGSDRHPTVLIQPVKERLQDLQTALTEAEKGKLTLVEVSGCPGIGKRRFAREVSSFLSGHEEDNILLQATFAAGEDASFNDRMQEFVQGLPDRERYGVRFSDPQDKMNLLGNALGAIGSLLKGIGLGFVANLFETGKEPSIEKKVGFLMDAFFEMLDRELEGPDTSEAFVVEMDNIERLACFEPGQILLEQFFTRLSLEKDGNLVYGRVSVVVTNGKDHFGNQTYHLPLSRNLFAHRVNMDVLGVVVEGEQFPMDEFTLAFLSQLGFDNHSRFKAARELGTALRTPKQLLAVLRGMLSMGLVKEEGNALRILNLSSSENLFGASSRPDQSLPRGKSRGGHIHLSQLDSLVYSLKRTDDNFINWEVELGDNLFRILRCCAVVAGGSRKFRTKFVADILGEDELRMLEALDLAEEKGVVRDHEDYGFYEFRHQWMQEDFLRFGSAFSENIMSQLEKEYRREYVEAVGGGEKENSLPILTTRATHAYMVWECFPELACKINRIAALSHFHSHDYSSTFRFAGNTMEILFALEERGEAIPDGIWDKELVHAYTESGYNCGQDPSGAFNGLVGRLGFPGDEGEYRIMQVLQAASARNFKEVTNLADKIIGEPGQTAALLVQAKFYRIWAMDPESADTKVSAFQGFLSELDKLLDEKLTEGAPIILQTRLRTLNALGFLFLKNTGNSKDALHCFQQSNQIMEDYPELENPYTRGGNHSGMADCYEECEPPDLELAKEHNLKNYRICKAAGMLGPLATSTSKLGGIALKEYDENRDDKYIDSAEGYYRESLFLTFENAQSGEPSIPALAYALRGLSQVALELANTADGQSSGKLQILVSEIKVLWEKYGDQVSGFHFSTQEEQKEADSTFEKFNKVF